MKLSNFAGLLAPVLLAVSLGDAAATSLAYPTFAPPPKPPTELLEILFQTRGHETFFSDYYGKRPMHNTHNETKNTFTPLEADFKSIFKEVKKQNKLSTIDRRVNGKLSTLQKNYSLDNLVESVNAGESYVYHLTDQPFQPAPLKALQGSLQAWLKMPTSMNMYVTGANGVALKPHTDRYDAVVLQVEGSKIWEICVPPAEQPEFQTANVTHLSDADLSEIQETKVKNTRGCTVYDADKLAQEMNCETLLVQKGDVLYLPKGIIHSAKESGGDVSVHLTIGLQRTGLTFKDLVQQAIKELQGKTLGSVVDSMDEDTLAIGWRRTLPSWSLEALSAADDEQLYSYYLALVQDLQKKSKDEQTSGSSAFDFQTAILRQGLFAKLQSRETFSLAVKQLLENSRNPKPYAVESESTCPLLGSADLEHDERKKRHKALVDKHKFHLAMAPGRTAHVRRKLAEDYQFCLDVCLVALAPCQLACAVLKTKSCDGTCTSSCDSSCTSSCDTGGICTTSCDDGCTTSCDSSCLTGCDGFLTSCDSGCTKSCDDGCTSSCDGCTAGTSCDSGCTQSCDGSCISSCDEYTDDGKCMDTCDDVYDGCVAGCNDALDWVTDAIDSINQCMADKEAADAAAGLPCTIDSLTCLSFQDCTAEASCKAEWFGFSFDFEKEAGPLVVAGSMGFSMPPALSITTKNGFAATFTIPATFEATLEASLKPEYDACYKHELGNAKVYTYSFAIGFVPVILTASVQPVLFGEYYVKSSEAAFKATYTCTVTMSFAVSGDGAEASVTVGQECKSPTLEWPTAIEVEAAFQLGIGAEVAIAVNGFGIQFTPRAVLQVGMGIIYTETTQTINLDLHSRLVVDMPMAIGIPDALQVNAEELCNDAMGLLVGVLPGNFGQCIAELTEDALAAFCGEFDDLFQIPNWSLDLPTLHVASAELPSLGATFTLGSNVGVTFKAIEYSDKYFGDLDDSIPEDCGDDNGNMRVGGSRVPPGAVQQSFSFNGVNQTFFNPYARQIRKQEVVCKDKFGKACPIPRPYGSRRRLLFGGVAETNPCLCSIVAV